MDEMIPHAILTIQTIDGQPMIDSRNLAGAFGKRHADVLRVISNEIKEEGNERNFALIFYEDTYGRQQPCYLLTKTAAIAIAMGFTGDKARSLRWSMVRIMEQMERKLQEQQKQSPPQIVVQEVASDERIRQLINEALDRRAAPPKKPIPPGGTGEIDWVPFIREWWATHGNEPIKARYILEIMEKYAKKPYVFGNRDQSRKAMAAGSRLMRHNGFRVQVDGIELEVVGVRKRLGSEYFLKQIGA